MVYIILRINSMKTSSRREQGHIQDFVQRGLKTFFFEGNGAQNPLGSEIPMGT